MHVKLNGKIINNSSFWRYFLLMKLIFILYFKTKFEVTVYRLFCSWSYKHYPQICINWLCNGIVTWMVWFLTISIHLRYFSFFPHIIYSPGMNRFVYVLYLENIDKLFFKVIVMHAVSKVEYLASTFWILKCKWVTWGSS